MFSLLLACVTFAAEPFGGVEWRPLSRADLMWVDEGRTSGVAVGSFDGTSRPALQAYGGAWLGGRVGLSLSLGVARLQNTTTLSDSTGQQHWGVVRPGFDVRWSLMQRQHHRPFPWLIAGLHGDIPSARDIDTGYTEEEQAAADALATSERSRLGGAGCRGGIGVDYEVLPGLALGAMYTVQFHRATWQADDVTSATQWLAGEAALLLQFRWPKAQDPSVDES